MMQLSSVERPSSPLDRVLSPFAEIRPGEATSALLLALNVFLLLASYYVLKTVREPLILTLGGAEMKSYAAAFQAGVLFLVVGAYSRFAAKFDRIRLITGMSLFFILNLGVFSLLGSGGAPIGFAFFVWVGVFNLFVVAQFWGFANDVYSEEQGKRLFPVVGVGASLGAWVGSLYAGHLFKSLPQHSAPYTMMLIAAAGLSACIGLSWVVHRREGVAGAQEGSGAADEPIGGDGAFQLIFRQRYLLMIAMLLLVVNVVNTLGEFLLSKVVTADIALQTGGDKAAMTAQIGAFYGDFFSWVNLLSFLFQAFLVSRLFKLIGVRGALFILPVIAMGGYGLMVAVPVLAYVRMAKILENSVDYSIQQTTRHALFLPTSREAKYKAKAAIDSFFWRLGDMLQAGVVFVGTQFAFGVPQFATFNVAMTAVWLVLVWRIAVEHAKLTRQQEASALPEAA
ncbi:MAG: Npt1/Npt2 family nucleotide transporter [Bryobacterales bacterium]